MEGSVVGLGFRGSIKECHVALGISDDEVVTIGRTGNTQTRVSIDRFELDTIQLFLLEALRIKDVYESFAVGDVEFLLGNG